MVTVRVRLEGAPGARAGSAWVPVRRRSSALFSVSRERRKRVVEAPAAAAPWLSAVWVREKPVPGLARAGGLVRAVSTRSGRATGGAVTVIARGPETLFASPDSPTVCAVSTWAQALKPPAAA